MARIAPFSPIAAKSAKLRDRQNRSHMHGRGGGGVRWTRASLFYKLLDCSWTKLASFGLGAYFALTLVFTFFLYAGGAGGAIQFEAFDDDGNALNEVGAFGRALVFTVTNVRPLR